MQDLFELFVQNAILNLKSLQKMMKMFIVKNAMQKQAFNALNNKSSIKSEV
jgi:hypothetical protein